MHPQNLNADLDLILEKTHSIWPHLKNKNIFLTGGTGFVGSWLLETFCWANHHFNLNMSVVVLTRDPHEFSKKAPHLSSDRTIEFLNGDVRNFNFPKDSFSHIIHAGTYASAKFNEEHPQLMFDTIVQGTRHTLDFAAHCGAQKFLFVSSGAVYGKQSPEMSALDENFKGIIDHLNPSSAYAIGKHTAEHMCVQQAVSCNIAIKIARCFAFVGPYFPLDRHFAVGNFIRDGLMGNDIYINGDGTPYRSYQYAADLVIWLLHILCYGKNYFPYNVGSNSAISISDLATLVAQQFSPVPKIVIRDKNNENKLPERYIPAIARARHDLQLQNYVDLQQAIAKTIAWYRMQSKI